MKKLLVLVGLIAPFVATKIMGVALRKSVTEAVEELKKLSGKSVAAMVTPHQPELDILKDAVNGDIDAARNFMHAVNNKGRPSYLWYDTSWAGDLFAQLVSMQGLDEKVIQEAREATTKLYRQFLKEEDNFSAEHGLDVTADNYMELLDAKLESDPSFVQAYNEFRTKVMAAIFAQIESYLDSIPGIQTATDLLYYRLYHQAANKLKDTPGWDQSYLTAPMIG